MTRRKPPKPVLNTPEYASIVKVSDQQWGVPGNAPTRHVPSGVDTVIRDGMAFNLIDRGQLASLLEIARLADLLLEYTERGGAAANRLHEFISLVEELRLLKTVLDAEPGTGEAVGSLLRMLDSMEE